MGDNLQVVTRGYLNKSVRYELVSKAAELWPLREVGPIQSTSL